MLKLHFISIYISYALQCILVVTLFDPRGLCFGPLYLRPMTPRPLHSPSKTIPRPVALYLVPCDPVARYIDAADEAADIRRAI